MKTEIHKPNTGKQNWLWLTLPAWGHTIPVARLIDFFNYPEIQHTVFSTSVWQSHLDQAGFETLDYLDFFDEFPNIDELTQISGIKTLINWFEKISDIADTLVTETELRDQFDDYDTIVCDATILPLVQSFRKPHQKTIVYQASLMMPPAVAKNVIIRYAKTPVFKNLLRLIYESVIYLPKISKLVRDFNQKHGTNISPLNIMEPKADYSIALTSKYFQILPNKSADTYFVGPLLSIDNQMNHAKKSDHKRAYVSLGTMTISDNSVLDPIVNALLESGYHVAVKIPHQNYQADWKNHPNVVTSTFFDQIDELNKSSLFVTHAGKNSADEAIWTKTPTISVPQANDQFIIAPRLVELGLGLMTRKNPTKKRFKVVLDKFHNQETKIIQNLEQAYLLHITDNRSETDRLFDDLGLYFAESTKE